MTQQPTDDARERIATQLARVLAFYTEDGTMTAEAVKWPCDGDTEPIFIEDVKKFFEIADKLGYRHIDPAKLTVLSDEEKLACSLVSRYSYQDVEDVIDESCLHMLDHIKKALGIDQ